MLNALKTNLARMAGSGCARASTTVPSSGASTVAMVSAT
jgi:hypothetical protein